MTPEQLWATLAAEKAERDRDPNAAPSLPLGWRGHHDARAGVILFLHDSGAFVRISDQPALDCHAWRTFYGALRSVEGKPGEWCMLVEKSQNMFRVRPIRPHGWTPCQTPEHP